MENVFLFNLLKQNIEKRKNNIIAMNGHRLSKLRSVLRGHVCIGTRKENKLYKLYKLYKQLLRPICYTVTV